MATYPHPSQNVPIFNANDFETGNTSLTLTTADNRYLQLSGGVERGLVTFSAGLSTASISNSGNTFTVPSSSGQLALVSQIPSSANFVTTNTNQTIAGTKTFTQAGLLMTDGSANASTFAVAALSGNWIYTFPNKTGTIAMLSDITPGGAQLNVPNTWTALQTFGSNLAATSISNTGTLTLPTSTDTLVGRATTDTLTNKTLTNPSFNVNTFLNSSGNTITIPSAAQNDTLLGQISTNFVQNKSLYDSNNLFVNSVDNTKQLKYLLSGQTTGTTLTIQSNQTTSQALNIPNITGTDTISTLGLTQTITGTKSFTGGSGIATSGVYPRTSASNQQSSTFTTPAIQIGGNTNDGIYSSGTDIIDFGSQGTNYISLQPQGIYRFVGGTVDPAIVFNQRIQAFNGANGASSPGIQIDNQNSGFYRVNQGTIGIGISGVATARWSSAGLNIFGVAGTAGAPALVLANDTTSGLYRPAANQIGVSISGSQVGNWTSTGLAITGGLSTTTTINSAAGTVGNPSMYFSTDTTSGFYRPSANQIGISISGSQVGLWNTLGLTVTGNISGSLITGTAFTAGSGSAATPIYTLNSEFSTGWYRSAANQWAWSASGTNVAVLSSTGLNIVPGSLTLANSVQTSSVVFSGSLPLFPATSTISFTDGTTETWYLTDGSNTGIIYFDFGKKNGAYFSAQMRLGANVYSATVSAGSLTALVAGNWYDWGKAGSGASASVAVTVQGFAQNILVTFNGGGSPVLTISASGSSFSVTIRRLVISY